MGTAVLEPVDLSLPSMKELGAKWLTGMAEYLAANPQFAVNGFIRSGIANALDHNDNNDSSIVGLPITIAVDDDEDSDYQIDSASEDDNE